MLAALPFPYIVSCAIVALLVGGPGLLLAHLIDHGDLNQSIELVLGPRASPWRSVLLIALAVAFYVYVFWNVRYSRIHILKHAAGIVALLPDREAGFRRIFGRFLRPLPVLLVAGGLITFFGVFLLDFPKTPIGPAELVIVGLNLIFASILEAQIIWNYMSTLDGIRRLGREDLQLKPSDADPMRGLRPLGSLSLRATFLYFGAMALVLPSALLNPAPLRPAYLAFLIVLLLMGAGLFVLPLSSIHRRMSEAKERDIEAVRRRATAAYEAPPGPSGNPEVTLSEVREWLVRTHGILAHEAGARRVTDLPKWPFETGAMDRILAITVTGVVAVVGRALVDVFLLG